jgi:hypothetical protein
MRVFDTKNPADLFDIPRGLAEYLFEVSDGRIQKYAPPRSTKLVADTEWQVAKYVFDGQPYITGKCRSCKGDINISGKGETARFFHCGIQEEVPEDIKTRAWELWERYIASGVRKAENVTLEQARLTL